MKEVKKFNVNNLYSQNNDELHAEEAVLIKLIDYLNNNLIKIKEIDLIVIRTNKQNKLRNSKPCCRCINFINNFILVTNIKINKIYYSIEDNIIVTNLECLNNDPNKHVPSSLKSWYNS